MQAHRSIPGHRPILAIAALLLAVTSLLFSQQEGDTSVIVRHEILFTWNDGDQGWIRTGDFVCDDMFHKLGGLFDGAAMVTERPNKPGTYTEGAFADTEGYKKRYPGPNLLISPWFDLSASKNNPITISFVQSILVEPAWDGSWMEYTTDGLIWRHLGVLNDPDGKNWYSTATYKNAKAWPGPGLNLPPDTATLMRYGLITGHGDVENLAWWTSNGNGRIPGYDLPVSPAGWIPVSLTINPSQYPDIYSVHKVRFRYVAFSDAAVAFEGWAIDNFRIEISK